MLEVLVGALLGGSWLAAGGAKDNANGKNEPPTPQLSNQEDKNVQGKLNGTTPSHRGAVVGGGWLAAASDCDEVRILFSPRRLSLGAESVKSKTTSNTPRASLNAKPVLAKDLSSPKSLPADPEINKVSLWLATKKPDADESCSDCTLASLPQSMQLSNKAIAAGREHLQKVEPVASGTQSTTSRMRVGTEETARVLTKDAKVTQENKKDEQVTAGCSDPDEKEGQRRKEHGAQLRKAPELKQKAGSDLKQQAKIERESDKGSLLKQDVVVSVAQKPTVVLSTPSSPASASTLSAAQTPTLNITRGKSTPPHMACEKTGHTTPPEELLIKTKTPVNKTELQDVKEFFVLSSMPEGQQVLDS
jgi:hypothetical protein